MIDAERQKLTLTLDGEGVDLRSVGIGDLSSLLSAVAEVVKAAGSDPAELALVEVREGSATFGMHATHDASETMLSVIANARLDGQADTGNEIGRSLDRVRRAIPSGMTLELEQRFGEQTAALELTREGITPDEMPLIRGHTTMYGVVTGVLASSSRPSARIRPRGAQRLVNLRVNQEQAQIFGSHLLKAVKVTGEAEWDPISLEIQRLKVETVVGHAPPPLADSVRELGELVKDAWSDVDVVRYIDDLRGDA